MERDSLLSAKIPVAMIGLGSVESIPLFHYNPGGVALRIALAGFPNQLYECDAFPVCGFGKGSKLLSPVPLELRLILHKASQWNVNTIIFDGLEPLNAMSDEIINDIIEVFRKKGYHIGVRTLGLADVDKLPNFDFIIVDYVKDYALDPALPAEAVKLLHELLTTKSENVWVEISTYVKEPDYWRLHPIILAIKERNTIPLHIYIEHHKGGGPIRDLYENLRKIISYVYIHNDLYPKLDTYCPNCGVPIASRDEGVLRAIELTKDNRCWKCNYPIPVRGSVKKKTPETLLLTVGEGGVLWYHPSQLLGSFAYWKNPM